MGYKKRGYSRDVPAELVRDYKLFAIACEGGKREPGYFNLFQYLSNKIKVDVIENYISDDEMIQSHENKSAPRWVLDRAMKYIEKNDLKDEDDLWFVIDKDRWTDAQIRELADYCDTYPNWNLVISNPCFEIWLYFHKKSSINSDSTTCNHFKKEISEFDIGGYHPYKYVNLLKEAISNSKENDTNKGHYLPNYKESKVYLLAEAILKIVGANDFELFTNNILPQLIGNEAGKRKPKNRK